MDINTFNDSRGWSTNNFGGSSGQGYQWFLSSSRKNVFRGFHGSIMAGSKKNIFVLEGSIFYYAVEWNPIDKDWNVKTKELSAKLNNSVTIHPSQFHGFFVTSDVAVVLYRLPSHYDFRKEQTFSFASLSFDFPFEDPIMSEKDQEADNFPIFD